VKQNRVKPKADQLLLSQEQEAVMPARHALVSVILFMDGSVDTLRQRCVSGAGGGG
jgi:hypothetical protein